MPSFGIWHLATDGDSQCKVHFVTILHNIKCWILLHHIFLPTMKKNRMFFLGSLDQKCRSQPFQIPVWILDTSLKAQPHHDKSPFRELERSYVCLVLLTQPSGDIEHALSWLISLSDCNASTIFSEVCWLNIQCWFNIRQKKSPLTNICIAIPQWGLIEGSGHLCHHHHPDWIRNKNISVYLIKRNILARQFLEQKSFISITREKCVDPLAARLTEPVTTMRQDCFGKFIRWKNISIKTSQWGGRSVSRWLHT